MSVLSFTKETDLPSSETSRSVSHLQEPKLQVSGVAISLLNQCMQRPNITLDDLRLSDNSKLCTLLKTEMPLLQSDHSKDMEWFHRKINLQKLLCKCTNDGPCQVDRSGSVPDLHEECRVALDQLKQAIRNERLELTKEAIVVLGSHATDIWSPSDRDESFRVELCSMKPLCTNRPLTPISNVYNPLSDLEMSFSGEGFRDDQSPGQAQESPTPVIHVFEEHNTTAKGALQSPSTFPPPISLPRGENSEEDGLVCTTHGAANIKLDESRSSCSSHKNNAILCQRLLDGKSNSSGICGARNDDHATLDTGSLKDVCEDLDGLMTDKTIDFSINGCCSELRVELPNLQNEKVILESRPATNRPEQPLANHLNQCHIFSSGESQANELTLSWSPIPRRVMHNDLKEEIEPTCIPIAIVSKPDCVVRSNQLLWKELGLRLLDIDEDDDELEANAELEVDEELGGVASDGANEIMQLKTATESSKSLNDSFSHRLSPQDDMIPRQQTQCAKKLAQAGSNFPMVNPLKRGCTSTDSPIKKITKQSILSFSATMRGCFDIVQLSRCWMSTLTEILQ